MKKVRGKFKISAVEKDGGKKYQCIFNDDIVTVSNETFSNYVALCTIENIDPTSPCDVILELDENNVISMISISKNKEVSETNASNEKSDVTVEKQLLQKKNEVEKNLENCKGNKISTVAFGQLLVQIEDYISLNKKTVSTEKNVNAKIAKVHEQVAKDKSDIKSNRAKIKSFLSRIG